FIALDPGLDVCVDLTAGSSPLTQTGMIDFAPGQVVIEAAQHKRVKYEAKCADIGYGFLPFSLSSFGELERDAVTLLKRIRRFSVTQDIGARAAIHIFNRIRIVSASGRGFSDWQWRLSTLSFAFGRLGVYSAGDVLNYAFLASRLQSASLQTKLFRHSGIVASGTTFDDALCVLLFSVSKPCLACFKVFTGDTYGDNVVSCAGIIGIKHRQNVVRNTMVDICFRSRILAGKEVDIGLSGGCDKPLRPVDMFLYSWDKGLDVCVDLAGFHL
ncbi:hypothetical protein Tco_1536778, partial [Tanacetum coccineum]